MIEWQQLIEHLRVRLAHTKGTIKMHTCTAADFDGVVMAADYRVNEPVQVMRIDLVSAIAPDVIINQKLKASLLLLAETLKRDAETIIEFFGRPENLKNQEET